MAGAGQLFGVVVDTQATTQGVAISNVQLLGVFAASNYRTGFAILKVDNVQKGVAEGEELAPGTKLVSVRQDHVLIERGGVQQHVNLENKYQGKNPGGALAVPAQSSRTAHMPGRVTGAQAVAPQVYPDEVNAAMELARKQQQTGQ